MVMKSKIRGLVLGIVLMGVSSGAFGDVFVITSKMTAKQVKGHSLADLRNSLQDVKSLIPVYQRFVQDVELLMPDVATLTNTGAQKDLENLKHNELLLQKQIDKVEQPVDEDQEPVE
jgi:hypothetical protein